MEKPLSNRETVGAGPPPPGPRGFPEPGSQPMRAPLDPERAGCEDSLIENSAPLPHRFVPQFAALDLGTNNCRLLIARPLGRGLSRRRRVLAHRPARRGTGRDRRPLRGGDGAHPRRAAGLRRQDRRAQGCRRPLCRHRGVPPRGQLRGRSSPGCATEIGLEIEIISSRRGGATRRRRLRTAARIRASPTRSSSTSAAARPRSSGCGWRAAPDGRRRPHILGSVSLPFGVVTLTDRFGGIEVSPATYRAMVAEADGGARAVRAHAIAFSARSAPAGCRCSAARAR